MQKIVPGDRESTAFFGYSVSIDGDYAIVGASEESKDASGGNSITNAGAAYIFKRNSDGSWGQEAKLVASDRQMSDAFGESVDISGNFAIVGADQEDAADNGSVNTAGAAYIFERANDGTWSEVTKLTSPIRARSDHFGLAVALQGDYAVIGAFADDEDAAEENFLDNAGSVYIFKRNSDGTWTENTKLVASDRGAFDLFGVSLDIDGDYLVVGAYQEDEDAAGENTADNAGAAYVFKRGNDDLWTEVAKLVASDRDADDEFGLSVAIAGETIIVGAQLEDEDANGENRLGRSGSAYVFDRAADGSWTETTKLVASDRSTRDIFGVSVDISGNYIIVGAFWAEEEASGDEAGAAYVFKRSVGGTWSEKVKLVSGDLSGEDDFGLAVAIDGTDVFVGASGEDEDENNANTLSAAGSAYIYQLPATVTWTGATSSDWAEASNWDSNAVPTDEDHVVLTGTVVDIVLSEDAEVNDLEIASGVALTLESHTLQVNGDFENNQTEGTQIASGASLLLEGTRSGVGSETFFQVVTGSLAYQTMSTPFSDYDFSDFDARLIYSYDNTTPEFVVPDTYTAGGGYFIAYDNTTIRSFSGTINHGNVDVAVVSSSGDGGNDYNLIGNPYAAAIDAKAFFTANSGSTTGTAWIWNDGAGNGGTKRLGNYVTVNSVGTAGVATPPDSEGDGSISKSTDNWNGSFNSFQGFFVQATASGTVSFTPEMQIAGNNDDASFFRSGSKRQQLRLSISDEELSDNLLIVLDENATLEEDYSMDGEKFPGNEDLSFYALQNEKPYAITALPHVVDEPIEVNLGINVSAPGEYLLQVEELADFEDDVSVTLVDNETGVSHVLQKGDQLVLTLNAEVLEDRFTLLFDRGPGVVTSIASEPLQSQLKVYARPNELKIWGDDLDRQPIEVYTIYGAKLYEMHHRTGENPLIIEGLQLPAHGIYILKAGSHSAKFSIAR